ncbi:MAG TPA: SRPBCC domain-containing protein [Candidatus Limnocylindrales bacterium]|nr:SRPBCC domain-containing protein [Candidatus Limnocylindrales bacterium]
MKLAGTISIAAPPGAVWALVTNPIGLARCVPGVGDIRQVDERTFEGTILASVGPVDGSFAFRSVMTTAEFPSALVVEVAGTDSVTKSRLEMTVRAGLTEPAAGMTDLAYQAEVKVRGRLAILGEMVLRATAGMMIGEVTKCLRSQLEGGASGADEGGGTVEMDAARPGIE